MDCNFKLTKLVFCLALSGVSLTGKAHDTNTTHPRITTIHKSVVVLSHPIPKQKSALQGIAIK